MPELVSYPSFVEAPFIVVEIAGHTFGSKKTVNGTAVEYPNFLESVNVTKINGELNLYTINMMYKIQPGDDPNFLDAIFSQNKEKYGWQKVIISYGDMACPSYVFKNEETIATKISSQIDFKSSKISYTLECTSTHLMLVTNAFTFPATYGKPSDILTNMVCNKAYGLQDAFPGMSSKSKIKSLGLIAGDDKPVKIEGKQNTNLLTYMNFLVNCMVPATDPADTIIKSSKYALNICDDMDGSVGGSYFKVQKVTANDTTKPEQDGPEVYTVDVGYPGDNFVTNFAVQTNDIWSIFYNYSQKLENPKYVYSIDDDGHLTSEYSPSVTTNKQYKYTTESDKTWWTRMTEFPINAQLTIKGLLKPSILCSKVRINCYFYGVKHISSGLYIITKQEDSLSASGYKTTLSLTRVSADVLK